MQLPAVKVKNPALGLFRTVSTACELAAMTQYW
jgi:hypothetical protein